MHRVSLKPVIQRFHTFCIFCSYIEVGGGTTWWLCAVSSARRASVGCHAGRMFLLDLAFAHGRKQSCLGARVSKAFTQASYWLEREEKAFQPFCSRSFTELAQSGLLIVLKSSYVVTILVFFVSVCLYAHTCVGEQKTQPK